MKISYLFRKIFEHFCSSRFRGQTQLYKSKPSDFQMAIEEALLAENGFLDTSFGTTTNSEENPAQFQEATGFYQDQEYYSQSHVSFFFLLWEIPFSLHSLDFGTS